MRPSLEPGVSRKERIEVDRDRTTAVLGEAMRVYSTPSMVQDVEHACVRLLQEHLDEGEGSVGIHVAIDHLAATPLGQWVDVEVTVSDIDRRKVTFAATASDAVEQVGRGEHVRFVLDVDEHQKRLQQKLDQLGS